MSRIKKLIAMLIGGLTTLLVAHCGVIPSGADERTATSPKTSILRFNATDSSSNEAVLPPSGKAAGEFDFVAEPALVKSGGCRCVSTATDGTKTINTGTFNSSGACSVSEVPNGQATICYELDVSGNVTKTFAMSDSSAIGGHRDGFLPSGNATVATTTNSKNGSATGTCSTCSAPDSGGTEARDLTGTWNGKCESVGKEDTGEVVNGKACPSLFTNFDFFIHRVTMKDGDGVIRYGYGAWPSKAAFDACGSRESLTDLPSGMSVTTTGQTGNFTWAAPFAGFSESTTSSQIQTMIQSVTGPSQTFTVFQTASCSGLTAAQCTVLYYWSIVFPYINNAPNSTCWPTIRATFNSAGVPTFSAAKAYGTKTQPMNRYDFMSSYNMGNLTYMKSFMVFEFPVYSFAEAKVVDCDIRNELLISGVTPETDPTPGKVIRTRFTNTTSVKSRLGTSADNATCRDLAGNNSEAILQGFSAIIPITFK